MKISIIKEVYSSDGWRKEGDLVDLDPKVARHYIQKGIGVEYKEEKIVRETKEVKAPKKRITKAKK
jgi:hypothetical protein